MIAINCLYWEDKPGQKDRFYPWLARAWDALDSGRNIDIVWEPSHEKAAEELTKNARKYDIFVADILFGEENEPLGLHLINLAREKNPDIAIIVLSVGDKQLLNRAEAAGADRCISKTDVVGDGSPRLLTEAMAEALGKHGREPPRAEGVQLLFNRDNLPLAALLEIIGEHNVKLLAIKLLKRSCSSIQASYVRSGLSGASVLRLDCDLIVQKGAVPTRRSILLKSARDQEQQRLQTELNMRDDVAAFPTGLFVPFQLLDEVVHCGGWYAIGAQFAPDATTLLDWLAADDVPESDIERTMRALFLGQGLKQVYQNSVLRDERPNVSLWNILTPSRRARVHLAIKELGALATKHGGGGLFQQELLMRFIMESKLVDTVNEEEVAIGTYLCRGHGDFHARNILVDADGMPKLIDPANITEAHWAADLARLMVDLIVSGWDYGDESHEWTNMSSWIAVCRAFVEGNNYPSVGADSTNKPVFYALVWLRKHLSEIHGRNFGKTGEAEFRLALAVEFLRAAYRQQDLPSPKRVLGLVAACVALRSSGEEFRAQGASI